MFIFEALLFFAYFLSFTKEDYDELLYIQNLTNSKNHKYAEFRNNGTSEKINNYFFFLEQDTVPASQILTFRIEFDSNPSENETQVYCKDFGNNLTDVAIIQELKNLDDKNYENSICFGGFSNKAKFDGIIKVNNSNQPNIGIILKNFKLENFTAKIYVNLYDKKPIISEETYLDSNEFSITPYLFNISEFRDKAEKIVLYSLNSIIQGFIITNDSLKPERLFQGNLLIIFSDLKEIEERYKDISQIIILNDAFDYNPSLRINMFEVKFKGEEFNVEYFLSSNKNGRARYKPLSIQMNICDSPYYFILNYNKCEKENTILHLEKIYGQIKNFGLLTKFTGSRFDYLINNDIKNVDFKSYKINIPLNEKNNIDIYKIECISPILLNFYYTGDISNSSDIILKNLNPGDATIFFLNPN